MKLKHRKWTEDEKEFVRAHYTGNSASVKHIARMTGHPLSSVKGQIYKLGLGQRIDYRDWTADEEEQLAELITQYHVTKVARILKRSVNSIAVKAQRMKLSRRVRDGYFTQKEVAQLLGVDHKWVHSRIIEGKLKAEPINDYIPSHGGSRYRIKEKDIKWFVFENALNLTGRNVDISSLVYIFMGHSK